MLRQLRPHQEKAITMLEHALRSGKRRPMLQAPTGFGKTVVAAHLTNRAVQKGKRVLLTVPALTLVDQTVTAFAEEGIDEVGVIQAAHVMTDWSQPVQIASIQTLQRRTLPQADLVLVDEAHRLFNFLHGWMTDPSWVQIPFIGLSATPWNKGLGRYYDDLLIPCTTAELIEAGYLCDFRVFAPTHPDLSRVRTKAGDFHEGDLAEVMTQKHLVADVVETWLRQGEMRPTICFAVNRAHAGQLQMKFQAAGVAAGYMDAYTPALERERLKQAFQDGTIRVVCNVGCLTTGVDWDVRCIILARPTKSEMLFVQMIGRGLRTAEGKDHCLILDHSDTHLRLGFVTDIHHETLDSGQERQRTRPKSREALPIECPNCAFLKPPRTSTCPACGFKAERQANVITAEGDLVELSSRNAEPDRETMQRWYSMLIHIAHERGYRPGWAAHQFHSKFGDWPRGFAEHSLEPDAAVRGYVTHTLIRYSRRERRHARAT